MILHCRLIHRLSYPYRYFGSGRAMIRRAWHRRHWPKLGSTRISRYLRSIGCHLRIFPIRKQWKALQQKALQRLRSLAIGLVGFSRWIRWVLAIWWWQHRFWSTRDCTIPEIKSDCEYSEILWGNAPIILTCCFMAPLSNLIFRLSSAVSRILWAPKIAVPPEAPSTQWPVNGQKNLK